MVAPQVSYLKAHGPYRCLRDGYRIYVCPLRLSCPISSATISPLRHFLPTTTAMAKTEITGDELNARTKVNGEQRGAHREKDCPRDRNEHGFKLKHAQDAALDRYRTCRCFSSCLSPASCKIKRGKDRLFELSVETDSTTATFARGTMRAEMASVKSLSTLSQRL